MPAYRFYLNELLDPGENYPLPKDEVHHIMRVMRRQPGDLIEIVNGKGRLAQGSLCQDGSVRVKSIIDRPPGRKIVIAQGIPKSNRLDLIVEKGTELGMTSLLLFPGDRSEKKELSGNQLARLEHLSISALKQCGRLDLPTISVIKPIRQWDTLPFPTFFGSLDADAPWLKAAGDVMVVIGPEGGVSDQEEAHLLKLGAQGVKLHDNILRTDTAPLVALALLHIPSQPG